MPKASRPAPRSTTAPVGMPAPRCAVLRPTTEPAAPIRLLPRPDAPFVAHLIATAEHAPQTRSLRRASLGRCAGRLRRRTRSQATAPDSGTLTGI